MEIQPQECHFSMPFLWLWGNVHENGKLHGSLVVEGIMGASRKFNMAPGKLPSHLGSYLPNGKGSPSNQKCFRGYVTTSRVVAKCSGYLNSLRVLRRGLLLSGRFQSL